MKAIINIRNFVWSIALIFLSSSLSAQSKKENEFSFVFMSDIHIKHDPAILKSIRGVIDTVNKLKPDFLLSGGDQVYDVMRGNEKMADSLFTLFKEETKAFNAPVHTTVGNHELFGIYKESTTDSTHAYYKYALYEKYFGKTYRSFDHEGWHFVILNNLDVKGYEYIAKFGEDQLKWLQEDLKVVDKKTPVVLIMHVPLVSVQNQVQIPKNGLTTGPDVINKHRLLDMLKPYNLKLVLQGHYHWFEDIYVNDKTHFITGGAVAGRPSWRGTDNGPRGFLFFKVKGDSFSYDFIEYENKKQ
jgi:3',5'-cyclic-AMP phosphodiesterase